MDNRAPWLSPVLIDEALQDEFNEKGWKRPNSSNLLDIIG